MKKFLGLDQGPSRDLGFLHFINQGENSFKTAGVLSSKIFAIRDLSNLLQGFLVEFLSKSLRTDRGLNHVVAIGADGDGVNPHSEGLGQFGSFDGGELSGVVHAIGQENDDLAFRRTLIETLRGCGKSGSDRGPILNESDSDPPKTLIPFEPTLGEGKRTGKIGASGKGEEADSVIVTALDELPGYFLGGLQSIHTAAFDPEILDLHGPRDIDRNDQLDPALGDLLGLVDPLWARQGENEAGEGKEQGRESEASGSPLGDWSQPTKDMKRRENDRPLVSGTAPQQRQEWQQQEQGQHPGVGQLERGFGEQDHRVTVQ